MTPLKGTSKLMRRIISGTLIAMLFFGVSRDCFVGLQMTKSAKAATVKTKTVEFFIGQDQTSTNGVAANADWSKAFSIELPDAVAGAPIKSAWVEYTFQMVSTVAAGVVTNGLTPQGQSETVFSSASYTSSGENFTIRSKPDFTSPVKAFVTGPGTYNFTFRGRVAGSARKMENAKMFVTYDYDDTAATQINTVRYMMGQSTGNVAVGATGVTFSGPNLAIAENSPLVVSAWSEIRGQVPSTGTTDDVFAVNYDSDSASNYYSDNAGGTDGQAIYILHQKNAITLNASHTLKVAATAGYQMNLVSAEQVITYKFNYANSSNLTKTAEVMLGSDGTKASAVALAVTATVNIPEDSISMKNAYLRGSAHALTTGSLNLAAKLGAVTPTPTVTYSYTAATEVMNNFWILSGDINDLAAMAKGDNQISATFAGTVTSRAMFLVYTYAYAKSSLNTSGNASFWARQQTAYSTTDTPSVAVDIAGSPNAASFDSFVSVDAVTGATTDRVVNVSTQPTGAATYNYNSSGEYQWLLFCHKNAAAEITANGTYVLNLNSTASNVMAAIVSLSYRYEAGEFALGVTAGSQASTLLSGAVAQLMNDPSCAAASACAAFSLSTTKADTLTALKLSETGTADAVNSLSNLALFYDTDGNYANGVDGQYGATVANFTAGDVATTSGSLAIAPGTTYYFYVRIDLKNGTNYPVAGESIDFQVSSNGEAVFSGGTPMSGAPAALAGTTLVKPQVVSYANVTEPSLDYVASCTGCGARIGPGASFRQTLTISGYGFGSDPGLGNRDSGTNKVEVVGTSTIMLADDGSANTNVSAWSNTSISIRTDSSLSGNVDADWGADFGGAGALRVTAGGQASNALNFFIFPQVTSLTAPTAVADAAREYDPGDADGVITLNGTRFGTGSAGGWVRILGCDATTCSSPSGSATTTAWSNTAITVQVPTVIPDNAYTGSVVMQQGSGAQGSQDTYTATGFRILPRLSSFSPASAAIGDAVTANGDHLCQNGGSCPVAFDGSNMITFSPGAAAVTLASWTDTAIQTVVPAGTVTGMATTTSNGYFSNAENFTILSSIPSDPTDFGQFKDSDLTQAIAVGGTASATPIFLALTMQASVPGGTLYPQIEYKPVGSAFVCAAGACGSAVEGAGVAGPGPIDCSQAGNGCAIAIAPADSSYHWQGRVRHRKGGVDYYSAWVSFGGNAESASDLVVHVTPPVISAVASSTTANSAAITWTTDELSTSQVQYSQSGTFVNDCATNGDCTVLDASLVTSHSVDINSLASTTPYFFRVRSIDSAGNESLSSNYVFTTTGAVQIAVTGDLASVVFDTASSSDGPAYNSILWQGVLGGVGQNEGRVRFQLAASDCANGATDYPACSVGTWSYVGGTTCAPGDWYDPGGPGVPAEIGCFPSFNNKRYYRYKVQVCSGDCSVRGDSSPRVDDIVVNYSP